jgi:hypothetical protein
LRIHHSFGSGRQARHLRPGSAVRAVGRTQGAPNASPDREPADNLDCAVDFARWGLASWSVCQLKALVYPQISSTDVNDFIWNTPLVVGAPGVAAQRITSVACKRRAGGMVRPKAWAVFRLMTNSNCVGCSIGKSAGFAPCRILST